MSSRFLLVQGSYKVFFVGICDDQGLVIDRISETEKTASSMLLPHCSTLLARNNLAMSDIQAIFVDQGPGSFSSLRVILSTVNALAVALQKPLIGIDGLKALAYDLFYQRSSFGHHSDDTTLLAVLLNAYNVETYCALYDLSLQKSSDDSFFNHPDLITYMRVPELIELFNSKYSDKKILAGGNGATVYHHHLVQGLGDRCTIIKNYSVASLDAFALMGSKCWRDTPYQDHLFSLYPLYLKTQYYAVQQVNGSR